MTDREQIRRDAEESSLIDSEAVLALLALLAELEQAEQKALDWQAACEESQASESDLMMELTESKKLYEYAQHYRSETEKKLEQAERERDEAIKDAEEWASKFWQAERVLDPKAQR